MWKQKEQRKRHKAARNVHEEWQKQLNMRCLKLSSDKEGRPKIVHDQADDERHERTLFKLRLGLTCSAEHPGNDVRVIDWKKKGEKRKGIQKTAQRMEAMDQIGEFKMAYMNTGTTCVTMTGAVPARKLGANALAVTPGERYKNRAQIGTRNRIENNAGEGRTRLGNKLCVGMGQKLLEREL